MTTLKPQAMRSLLQSKLAVLCASLLVVFFVGCSKEAPPVTPISLEQIPAEMGKAFANAKAEAKEQSEAVVAALQKKDFAKASSTLDALAGSAGLSDVQYRTVAGAAMTVNTALLEAESKGDKQATETLNNRRLTK